MELFDLYTADRVKTGKTMVRGEPVPEGCYRIVVHICIFNEQGQMLIQQRQPFKRGWPGRAGRFNLLSRPQDNSNLSRFLSCFG